MHTQKLWSCTQEADHIPGWQPLYSFVLGGNGLLAPLMIITASVNRSSSDWAVLCKHYQRCLTIRLFEDSLMGSEGPLLTNELLYWRSQITIRRSSAYAPYDRPSIMPEKFFYLGLPVIINVLTGRVVKCQCQRQSHAVMTHAFPCTFYWCVYTWKGHLAPFCGV